MIYNRIWYIMRIWYIIESEMVLYDFRYHLLLLSYHLQQLLSQYLIQLSYQLHSTQLNIMMLSVLQQPIQTRYHILLNHWWFTLINVIDYFYQILNIKYELIIRSEMIWISTFHILLSYIMEPQLSEYPGSLWN